MTPAKLGSLLAYYWLRDDITGISGTRNACITSVVDSGEVH
jgi:hypothetical protein